MTLVKVKPAPAFSSEPIVGPSRLEERSQRNCVEAPAKAPRTLGSKRSASAKRRAALRPVPVSLFPQNLDSVQEIQRLDRQLLAPSLASVIGRTLHGLIPAIAVVIFASWIAAVASGCSPLRFLEQGLAAAEASQDLAAADYVEPADAENESMAQTAEEDSLIETADVVLPSPEPVDLAHLSDQISQVKFIAGLIAVHRPSIVDCGAVARDIVTLSAAENLDPFFIAAVISIESRFGAAERSHAGAMGLMQLLPQTAREVSVRRTGKKGYPLLTDTKTNIRLGIHYIKELEQRYAGNRFYALAAYNWGPAKVDRARAGVSRIPDSVKSYADRILERSIRWQKHFNQAKKSAMAMSEISRVADKS